MVCKRCEEIEEQLADALKEIEDWKACSGYATPEDVGRHIDGLEQEIESFESEVEALRMELDG